ncbi:MAG: PRC-barrel domain-containing protein [Parvularculaceae bacterium]|nr:PRC-barrel domain-containing protein [Parvularculaceae bacterium]
MNNFLSLETLRRRKVVSRAGQALGRVDDFIVDPEDGAVHYLVLSAGGALGIGDRQFAIPFADAVIDETAERFILPFDHADIANAPGFGRGAMPDFAPAYRKDIDGFYAARRKSES